MKRIPALDEFERLRSHLRALDGVFEAFCDEHGFTERTSGLGRYPRRRIVRYGELNLYFDLQMDLDESGGYFRDAFPDVPYSMGAGAWLDVGHLRFHKRFDCFKSLPFSQVRDSLRDRLREGYECLKNWDREHVRTEGERTVMAASR